MDLGTLFTICNTAVLPFWALLVLAPRWRVTERLVHSAVVTAVLGPIYAIVLLSAPPVSGGSMASLEGVMALFTSPYGVLAGWIHYLVFDLFVGAWEARDARRLGLPHGLLVPCLLLTLMFGPVGSTLYCAIRFALRRRFEFAPEPQPV